MLEILEKFFVIFLEFWEIFRKSNVIHHHIIQTMIILQGKETALKVLVSNFSSAPNPSTIIVA